MDYDFPPQGVTEDWPDWLGQEGGIEAEDRIRRQTHTGWPCGSIAFMDQLESLLHRTVRPQMRLQKLGTKEVRKTIEQHPPKS